MAGRIKRITPPAVEPVTTAELRNFGRIPSDVNDATLLPLIKTARAMAESQLNRSIMQQTWEYVDDEFPALPLSLPMPPLRSLKSVTVTDTIGTVTDVDINIFIVDTAGAKGQIAIKAGKSWPGVALAPAGLSIQFNTGYEDADNVPDNIKTAITLGALWLYDHPGEEMTTAFDRLLGLDGVMAV